MAACGAVEVAAVAAVAVVAVVAVVVVFAMITDFSHIKSEILSL